MLLPLESCVFSTKHYQVQRPNILFGASIFRALVPAVSCVGKKYIIFVIMTLFILQTGNLFSDINSSVVKLLSSLTRQYLEAEQEIFFKKPLAVIPFVDSSPASREHEIGAVVGELISKEIFRSTYFILTERKNLDKILKEIELSLSDIASGESSVKVGEVMGAEILLAGSITEAGDNFILNGRLIDVESGVVIGAESVPVPRSELIAAAETMYSYVATQGLGFFGRAGVDFPVAGIDWLDKLKESAALLDFSSGVSYRPYRFLQLCASLHSVWTEFQMGEFDPSAADYDNTDLLTTYFTVASPGNTDFPSYGFEYSQKYLDIQALYVLNPVRQLALSFGGGGLIGLWNNYIKMNNFPVYIGLYDDNGVPFPGPTLGTSDPTVYLRKDVVINSGNGLLLGLLATFKMEYFLSPRILLFLTGQYKKLFAGDAYRYTLGGVTCGTGADDDFVELSGWIPGKTPYGDSLEFDMATIGFNLGVSISF